MHYNYLIKVQLPKFILKERGHAHRSKNIPLFKPKPTHNPPHHAGKVSPIYTTQLINSAHDLAETLEIVD